MILLLPLMEILKSALGEPWLLHSFTTAKHRDSTSLVSTYAYLIHVLHVQDTLGEPIMINIRLAFWGPIQAVTMNKKWQGNGWQRQRCSYWQQSSAKSWRIWTCNYLSSILSFFNSSVTFCGGGGDGMRISIGI